MSKIITGERYERLCKSMSLSAEYGSHVLSECELCGHVDWESSGKGEKQIVVNPKYSVNDCRVCATVMQRAPEIYQLIFGMANMLHRAIEKATREPPAPQQGGGE